MKIDSHHFTNIKMIYDNLGSKISDVVTELYAINGYNTKSYKFNVEKVHVYKKFLKTLAVSL